MSSEVSTGPVGTAEAGSSESCAEHVVRLRWFFVLAVAVCAPMVVYTRDMPTDAASYYARMAREIASGNWAHGFFPMIPPLVPCLGGGVSALLRVDAYAALKLVSTLFFALTVFPVYVLAREVWGKRTARWCALLYVFCSRLIRYGGSGLLDPAKTFFFVLMTCALVLYWRRGAARRHAVLVGVGAAGMALSRADGLFFAGLGCVALILMEVWKRRAEDGGRWWVPADALVSISVMLVLLCPLVVYQLCTIGYPLTDSRQLPYAKAVLDRFGYHPFFPSVMEHEPFPWVFGQQTLSSIGWEMLKGHYPPYLLLALPTIAVRLHRRRFTRTEWLVLGAWLVHTLLFTVLALRGWFGTKRYFVTVVPLLCGWTAIGLIACYDALIRRCPTWGRHTAAVVLGTCIFLSVWDGNHRARPTLKPARRLQAEMSRDMAKWLATEGIRRVPAGFQGLKSTTASYHNGGRPVVLSLDANLVYLSRGDNATLPAIDTTSTAFTYASHEQATFDLDWLLGTCHSKRVHYVVLDPWVSHALPCLADLEKLPDGFEVAYDRWRSQGRCILAFTPNLK